MALNKVYDKGSPSYLPVSAGSVSGSPVAVGSQCGVALVDRDTDGKATVEFGGVFKVTVTGETSIGTPIYYTENADPDQRLGVVATALFFGYARAAKTAGAAEVMVAVGEASGISTLAAASLEGTVVKQVADANVIGGIPVLHRIAVSGGAAANTDVILTHKTRVIDAWAVHTGGAGETSDTIQVLSGSNAITDAMDWSGADTALVRAAQINDANHEIAAGGTLRVTTTDNDAGDDVGAGIVYVLGVRVA